MFDKDRLMLLMSAIQKAIRCCEVNAARYFASELIDMGAPHSAIGQLRIIAAEDIGIADPTMVGHINEFYGKFEELRKGNRIEHKNVYKYPALCNLIDSAVIAEAISSKSRDLPMANWLTLYDIHQKEDFQKSNEEYSNAFTHALDNDDEKEALYYGILLDKIIEDKELIRKVIIKHSEKRNGTLVKQWINVYKDHKNLLELSGSIALLCRDLKFHHGEYKDAIEQHLEESIEKAEIPNRAYDIHTPTGRKMGRSGKIGLDHFLTEGIKIEKERFANRYYVAGKRAIQLAYGKKLRSEKEIIEAIKRKYPPSLIVKKSTSPPSRKKGTPPSGILTFE